jgi:hypothetical protein
VMEGGFHGFEMSLETINPKATKSPEFF